MAQDASVFQRSFLRYFLILGAWCFLLHTTLATAQTSSVELSADAETEASASDSESETTSSSKSGLSQGYSVTEAVSLSRSSSWSSVARTGMNRYLDEMAVSTITFGGSLSYRLSDRDSLSASLGYSAPTELVTAYPEEYGISDLSLSWVRRNVWSHSSVGSVSSSVGWRLPTSELSQKYTQISSFSGGLTLRRPMPATSALRHLTLLASSAVAFTPHQYDRRAMGTLNFPFSFVYSGGGTYNIYNTVNVTTSYSMQHRVDYSGYVQDIQTLSVGAVATLPESFFLSGGYQWRDTVLTNDPFLDADKTLAYLELSRAF